VLAYNRVGFDIITRTKIIIRVEYIMKKILPKGFYAITDEKLSNGKDNITVVKEMLDSGVKVLQYRDKYKQKIEKVKQCEVIRKLTEQYNCLFIVNDDIDIALAVKSDGLHLGQTDLPIIKAREIVGNDIVIGISTHQPKQALLAQQEGADYIGAGPIYQTFTKDDAMHPVGIEYLKFCKDNIKIPTVAIGGIKFTNIEQVFKCGPNNVCMISEILMSNDIKSTIRTVKEILNDKNYN
jgi:thiamine-phosphate pyrophosphorylase